jgi:phage terminase large subunit
MKTTDVFSWNLDAYLKFKGSQTLIVNQGGQGSSKNVSIIQLLYLIAKHSKKRLRIDVCSYALPHLKSGAMNDLDNVIISDGKDKNDYFKKYENKYYIGKSEISFFGIEGNEARATGPRREILYLNEANKRIKYKVFELMNARTSLATLIDFNPSAEFWFHEKVMPNFDYHLIKSTFLHNPYLPERERQNLLAKKDKPGFENWWKVYGLGLLGQLEGAIFKNWRFGEFDNSLPFGFGLDFGVKDPDALVRCAIDHKAKKIYLKEELYESGLSTDSLAIKLKSRVEGRRLIVADSSAKRTILDLLKKGLNIEGASKNQIVDDIKAIKEYELIIDPESYNLEKELNNWIWLDKKGEIPIDENNHLLDACRYIIMKFLKPNKRKGQRAL